MNAGVSAYSFSKSLIDSFMKPRIITAFEVSDCPLDFCRQLANAFPTC